MGGPSLLHVEHFRDNERSWNDRAEEPIAVFIGLSPGGKYFRCFEFHAEENVDCRVLASNGFGSAILDVVARSGYELTGTTKRERVESFSRRFCLVDMFESESYVKPAKRQAAKGQVQADSLIREAAESVKRIAKKCREQGRSLLVIAALGGCVEAKDRSRPGTKREFRWLLWGSLRENVEAEYKVSVLFIGWIDAHLFGMQSGDAGKKDEWESRVREILSKALRDDRKRLSEGSGG